MYGKLLYPFVSNGESILKINILSSLSLSLFSQQFSPDSNALIDSNQFKPFNVEKCKFKFMYSHNFYLFPLYSHAGSKQIPGER